MGKVVRTARDEIVRRARAKVNLWLNVVGRRADGFHLLESLVAFADLADTLEVAASDVLSLTFEEAAAAPGVPALAAEPDNLVLKAARLLARHAGVAPRAAFRLAKRIPVAAGLGGGSADAAAALLALVELWHLRLSDSELLDLAAVLGADVPMCVAGRTSFVSGVGERLAATRALPPCAILLVNPGVALSTAEVFTARHGGFSPHRPPAPSWTGLADFVEVLSERGNDLTPAAVSLRPVVGEVLSLLGATDGARYAGMSGSGATCFALYATAPEARRAATHLPRSWWHHAGSIGPD
jgi:4-diphosphocytidyl-2-C-methyl-D-erythritol kinase